jgi:mRNA-degrading endonuclease toxin of MazEF toxin-antitoxin module
VTSGDVLLCDLNPVAGREHGGIRPVVTRLKQVSYAMTEQVRAISEQRAGRQLGRVSGQTLTAISRYLHLFIV